MLRTDESKFEVFGTNRGVYVRRCICERLIDGCISPKSNIDVGILLFGGLFREEVWAI